MALDEPEAVEEPEELAVVDPVCVAVDEREGVPELDGDPVPMAVSVLSSSSSSSSPLRSGPVPLFENTAPSPSPEAEGVAEMECPPVDDAVLVLVTVEGIMGTELPEDDTEPGPVGDTLAAAVEDADTLAETLPPALKLADADKEAEAVAEAVGIGIAVSMGSEVGIPLLPVEESVVGIPLSSSSSSPPRSGPVLDSDTDTLVTEAVAPVDETDTPVEDADTVADKLGTAVSEDEALTDEGELDPDTPVEEEEEEEEEAADPEEEEDGGEDVADKDDGPLTDTEPVEDQLCPDVEESEADGIPVSTPVSGRGMEVSEPVREESSSSSSSSPSFPEFGAVAVTAPPPEP